ncbi:MAG: alpha-mannosidase, partial [Actinomycetota bacterium]
MAHDVTAPALQRLRRLLTQRVRPAVLRTVEPFGVSATPESFDPVPFAAIGTQTLEPFTIGDPWGRPWHSRWFHLSARLHEVCANEQLVAHVDLGFTGRGDGFQVEGLAWQDGRPVQAVQPDRRLIPLRAPSGTVPGGARGVELWIEAAATPVIAGHASGYGPTPLGDPRTAGSAPLYALRRAELCIRDESVARLSTMLHALMDLIIDLDHRQPYRARLFAILEALERVLDPADVAGTATPAITFLDES